MLKRFLVAPDSFKGTLSAGQVCDIIAGSIRRFVPDASVRCLPMADGGEGMTEAYIRLLHGVRKHHTVCGPEGQPVDCTYGVLPDGTAVMEMAACAGLTLVRGPLDPFRATTFGVGQLLRHAAESGVRKVLLGIGGSATNDLGIGMAAALGYRFLDEEHKPVEPLVQNFARIRHIEKPARALPLEIAAACDVDNPLCGENGATYTFGPQKGVPPAKLAELDGQMAALAQRIEEQLDVRVQTLPGAGAAGGLGAGLVAFAGARLCPGAELLLEAAGFDELLQSADLVFTGEGRIDWQSAAGKVPVSVAHHAQRAGVPCVALCGSVGPGAEAVYAHGITAIFPSILRPAPFAEIKPESAENMRFLADSVLRLLTAREASAETEAQVRGRP